MLLSAALASLGLSFTFALGGVGAAAALVPVLHSMGMALSMARPLGLLINTLSLSSASYVNIKNGKIRVRDWVPLIGASLCGAPIGAYVSTKIPEEILLQVFAAFLAIAGLVMLIGIRKTGEKEKMSPFTQLFRGAVSGLPIYRSDFSSIILAIKIPSLTRLFLCNNFSNVSQIFHSTIQSFPLLLFI